MENIREMFHGVVMGSFEEKEEEILKRLYPNSELKGINPRRGKVGVHDLLDIGSRVSNFYEITHEVDDVTYRVFARHYIGNIPKGYRTLDGTTPWEKAALGYAFLEEAGVENIPKSFLHHDSRTLFLEAMTGKTLGEILKNAQKKHKVELLVPSLKVLSVLQYRASEKLKQLSDERKKNLFATRDIEEQAGDYFGKVVENPNNGEIRKFVSSYRLIKRAVEGNYVSHGDLGPTNIIISPDEKAYFIDPELKIRSEFNDLGSLIAYLGTSLGTKEWDDLARTFKRIKLELMIAESGGKTSNGFLRLRPPFEIGEKGEKLALFSLYGSIFYYSLRIAAKNHDSQRYETCKSQDANMRTVLDEFICKPDKFGLSPEDVQDAKMLKYEYENSIVPEKFIAQDKGEIPASERPLARFILEKISPDESLEQILKNLKEQLEKADSSLTKDIVNKARRIISRHPGLERYTDIFDSAEKKNKE